MAPKPNYLHSAFTSIFKLLRHSGWTRTTDLMYVFSICTCALPTELQNVNKLTLQDSNLRLSAWMLFLTLRTVALPTELKVNVAASGVTHFFYRGPTSRLKFVFSLQLFFTALAFSIGGFIPPRTLPTSHL